MKNIRKFYIDVLFGILCSPHVLIPKSRHQLVPTINVGHPDDFVRIFRLPDNDPGSSFELPDRDVTVAEELLRDPRCYPVVVVDLVPSGRVQAEMEHFLEVCALRLVLE